MLTSPREYNYLTDRIFAKVNREEVLDMAKRTPRQALERAAAQMFTSRSGFVSHYSSNPDNWGDMTEWDHNQFGALLLAYIEEEFGPGHAEEFQNDFASESNSNGRVDDAIDDAVVESTRSLFLELVDEASDRRRRRHRRYAGGCRCLMTNPALHACIEKQDFDGIEAALKAGADPNATNDKGMRPLHVFAGNYKTEIFQGAANATPVGQTRRRCGPARRT